MVRIAFLALAASAVLAGSPVILAGGPALALDAGYRQFAQAGDGLYGEETVRPLRRARTRIEVRPDYQGRVPPGTRRECAFRLVQEFRPSGTVVVPRERCWWVR